MENASKALLIAAAIIIAIILISLGVYVVRQGQSATGNINLTEHEITAFNSKWESYQGTQIGSSVRSMVNQINNYNRTVNDGRYITIEQKDNGNYTPTNKEEFATSNPSTGATGNEYNAVKYSAGTQYTIIFDYTSGGLISKIVIIGKQIS